MSSFAHTFWTMGTILVILGAASLIGIYCFFSRYVRSLSDVTLPDPTETNEEDLEQEDGPPRSS